MDALGLLLVTLGVATANSESVLVSTILLFAGALILLINNKEKHNGND